MRLWPFSRRESRSYTDVVLEALASEAASETTGASRTGAVRACSGLLARAFASADVAPEGPRTQPLTPSVLSRIGRDLVECGSSVWRIRVTERDGLSLVNLANWEKTRQGYYRFEGGGRTRSLPPDSVLHFRWAGSDRPPWAGATGSLLGGIERTLSEESAHKSAYLLPLPGDPADSVALKTAIQNRKGNSLVVRTLQGGLGDRQEAIRAEYLQRRIGQDPPEMLLRLRQAAESTIYAAVGLPPSLFALDATDGVLREGARQALHAFIEPAAAWVVEEASTKLDVALTLTFDRLRASDLRGRAQAIKALVESGVSLDDALRRAGLD